MESPDTRYDYEKLHDLETIRTLTLQGISDGIIECTIQQIGVSDGGYQALSYVWGNEVKPFYALVVDDKGEKLGRIPLTENLNDALRDLWNAEELTNKVFWIDQICIDQEGEEKSHQVAMMGQIYRNAARVITYLGPAEDEEVEREGLQLLERLDRHFAPNYEILAQWDDIIAVHYGRSELPVSKLPGDLVGDAINERVWKWLVSLCFGEWALRLWIVQEQLLNADNLMLHGSQVLSWEAVVIMPTLFYLDLIPGGPVYALWETRRPELSLDPWEISGSLFYIWQAHHLKEKRPEAIIPSSITLFANMARFEGLLCRDPRDRIFALLAISSDSIELGIIPDYSKPPKQLFLDASVSFFLHRNDLAPLYFACRTDNLSDPTNVSWAINSPQPAESKAIYIGPIFRSHPSTNLHPSPHFYAHEESSVIVLTGRIVDHISLTTPPLYRPRSTILAITDTQTLDYMVQFVKAMSEVLLNVGTTLENTAALVRALVIDPNWKPTHGRGSPAQQTAYHFWCYFRFTVKVMENLRKKFDLEVDKASDSDHLSKALARLVLETDLDTFSPSANLTAYEFDAAMHAAYVRAQGRSLCTTKQGRVSSCMNKIESEDVIVAFRGADTLYVLRPAEGGRYRVVGDAYVDGLMFGEAYDGLDPDEVDYNIELI